MHQLNLPHVEFMAHSVAIKMMEWNEPIPPFHTRFPGRLESCLAAPYSTYDKQDLYPTLTDKAAILFYLMIKNHPFQNGNKRIAIAALFTYLYINGKWITISNDDLYDLAIWVAESQPGKKPDALKAIETAITVNMKNVEDLALNTEAPALETNEAETELEIRDINDSI